jgi:hypothetical protein
MSLLEPEDLDPNNNQWFITEPFYDIYTEYERFTDKRIKDAFFIFYNKGKMAGYGAAFSGCTSNITYMTDNYMAVNYDDINFWGQKVKDFRFIKANPKDFKFVKKDELMDILPEYFV